MKLYLILAMMLFAAPAIAGDEHGDSVEISSEAAADSGIKYEVAGAASIDNMVRVNGAVMLNQNATARVKARFAGVVRSVKKQVGDQVTAGEVLATVESNESLQVYSVTAPISGVVMERNLSAGDEAAEEPIMIIADLKKLWAEFYIFSKDTARISEGQRVIIKRSGHEITAESTIATILPYAENSSQTLVARAVIDNTQGKWKPGYSIKALVAVSGEEVDVAVRTSALQKLEGKSVVFVKEGERYEARKVETGLSNDEWTEIKHGITAGEEYVAEGSFIIKAEIGKSAAEHAH